MYHRCEKASLPFLTSLSNINNTCLDGQWDHFNKFGQNPNMLLLYFVFPIRPSKEPHDKEIEFLGEKQTSCVIIAKFCQNYTKVPGHCPYVNTHVTNMNPPDVCFSQTLGGGIAYTRCFKKLNGVHYNNSFNATRKCESDGRWSRINFTACHPIPDSSDPAEDYVNTHLKIVVMITYVGRGLSLFTLIIAFLLFWRLRYIYGG
ncbi:unnamed protein product [Clavelina lepadiformis]|uniref:G-protein coupled receptors family 2 profile 1 domain-containing protein n=1 Tax=Clavelina lepadiformis TaxID=159417 RepID=A0ABP0G5V5_CLALP